MNRRFFTRNVLAGALAAPGVARAAAPARTVRIGILSFGDPPQAGAAAEPIIVALRRLGYAEGRNVSYVRRYAHGKRDVYATLATDVLRERLDVVYAPGSDIARAFKAASPQVPVVFTASDDPVATGLVQSLSRPGGMFTGVALMSPELAGKRLELLRMALPVLAELKIHPVWYGILLTIKHELALITPPGGMNLFALKAISRAPILEIIRGVAPYVVLLIAGLVLVMVFPAIALWLPGTMSFR
jgi:hypothetical protein